MILRRAGAEIKRYHKAMDGVEAADGAWCRYDDAAALVEQLRLAVIDAANLEAEAAELRLMRVPNRLGAETELR